MHSAPNPPMSQSYSFSLCFLGLFPSLCFISTLPRPLYLSLLLHVSLVYLCSPLIGLRQVHFFLTHGTLSWMQPFHRNEQIWWSMLPLCFAAHWDSHAKLAESAEICSAPANQLPHGISRPATCLHPTAIPPPMCLCVCIYSWPFSITFHTQKSLFLSPLITHCANVLLPTGSLPLIVLHLQLIKISSSSSLPLFFLVSFFLSLCPQ